MGKYALKLDWDTLTGVLSGSGTNPPALAYVSEQNIESDAAAVACATVYPLSMFLRVLAAQLLILLLVSCLLHFKDVIYLHSLHLFGYQS